MNTPPLATYLPYLALTLAVELPLLLLILRGRVSWQRTLVAGLLATGITHPQLWYLWPRLFTIDTRARYDTYVLVGELTVFVIEALVIAGICRGRIPVLLAVAASALANATSYLVGVMLGVLLG